MTSEAEPAAPVPPSEPNEGAPDQSAEKGADSTVKPKTSSRGPRRRGDPVALAEVPADDNRPKRERKSVERLTAVAISSPKPKTIKEVRCDARLVGDNELG